MRCRKLPTSFVTVLVCWTIRACADEPLLALLEARDEQQHALSHAISGTTAAAHSSKDFTYQLQQDKDPAELLANTDLPEYTSQQLISTKPASVATDLPQVPSTVSTRRPERERQHQFGPASPLFRDSGFDRQTGNQLGVAALKRRIEELNRILEHGSEGTTQDVQQKEDLWLPASVKVTLPQAQPLTRDDLALAVPTNREHLPLVKAGREWRKGMRAVVALVQEPTDVEKAEAAANNETWVTFPDDSPRRSPFFAGDSRAAMALGDSYKWLLYGDDDTVFFPAAAMQLLGSFDPDLPYAITDNLWFEEALVAQPPFRHPALDAPRCLPCHFVDDPLALRTFTGGLPPSKTTFQKFVAPQRCQPMLPFPSKFSGATRLLPHDFTGGFYPPGSPFKPAAWNFAAPRGCPCTPALLCAAEAERPLYGVAARGCADPPPPKAATYAIHGGAGALLSIGLMRRLNKTEFEACVLSLKSTGGDAFFTVCLWRAGYAPTDPGYSVFVPEARVFDPFQWEWNNDNDGEARMLLAIEAFKKGLCDRQCQLRLDLMVSAHVRSRWKGVPYASSQIGNVVRAYDEWLMQKPERMQSNYRTPLG
ncbi:g6056 [Coccomyxa elongata]